MRKKTPNSSSISEKRPKKSKKVASIKMNIEEQKGEMLSGFKGAVLNMTGKKFINNVIQDSVSSVPDIGNNIVKTEDLLKVYNNDNPLTEREVNHIRDYASEFLKNFVIYGYDFRGERILISNAKTPEEKDGLVEMSKNVAMVLFQMFNGGSPM